MTGYLGPSGTFSHIAAQKFCRDDSLKEFATIYSAIMAVEHGEIDACIVPIENSIEGSVNVTLDTLAFEANLFITGEYILKIRQNLLVKKNSDKKDIKTIISHPQAIGQCAKMLNKEFKNARILFADSTAKAAEQTAAGDGTYATIASEDSARINNLKILIPDCGDDSNNSTRFVRLSKNQSMQVSKNDKTSIAFTLENRSGALFEALSVFERYKINMIKIESRPVKTELGTYIFFIDIDGNIDDANIYFALEGLRKKTTSFKFLGSYKKLI